MSNTVNDLREALFKQLEALQSAETDTVEVVSRARAVSEIGRTILESAKLEIEHAKMIGNVGVEFLGATPAPALPDPAVRKTANGVAETRGNVTRHRIGG